MLSSSPTIFVSSDHKGVSYWKDLWRYRELFYFLAWRDVLVRYKQTVIGFAWALLRPLFMMIVFTIIFGNLANLPADDGPYAIMVFAALLPDPESVKGSCAVNPPSCWTSIPLSMTFSDCPKWKGLRGTVCCYN